jgi:transcriptional regulator with XRE-family HTH domain
VTGAHEFGLALRQARERRGLTVDDVALCTKVSAALFVGLERGDVSRWPSGIFRRAFVRGYAECVGLDPETVLAGFLRVYAEGDLGGGRRASEAAREMTRAPHDDLRLVLATDRRWHPSWRRVVGVGLDALASGLVCAAVLWGSAAWGPVAAFLAVGAVVCYYAAALLAWGTSLGLRLTSRVGAVRAHVAPMPAAPGASPAEPPRPAPVEARLFRSRDRRRAARADRAASRPARH